MRLVPTNGEDLPLRVPHQAVANWLPAPVDYKGIFKEKTPPTY
jgi:hypothetical protein